MEIVIKDLARYLNVSRNHPDFLKTTEKEISGLVFEGSFNHLENINVRLEMIYFVCSDLNEYNEAFLPEHLEVLWSLLYTNIDIERNSIYRFLGSRGLENK